MKTRLMALCVCAFWLAPGVRAVEPVDRELIPEARRVLEYLAAQYGKKTLSASTSGVAPFVFEATGRQPAMQGFDLSGWNNPTWGKSYTPVVEATLGRVQAWWQQGGIVSLQFHWKNPTLANGSAWAGRPPGRGTGPVDLASAVTPGTPVHEALMADLKKNADYLEKLAAARIPILWRPFHEIDGGWFWWTDTQQPENTAQLWRQMYDYLVKERHLHNLIWVYSAGAQPHGLKQALRKSGENRDPTPAEEIAFRKRYYPGDQYVDIAGIDIYPGGGYGPPTEDVYPAAFRMMQQVAPGKMLAMCESGGPLNPELMQKDGPKWLYNLQWFEGDPAWDRKVYHHESIITLDKLPVLTPHHAPPVVWLTAPVDGAARVVPLRAEAASRDTSIVKVEFRRIPGPWKNWFLISAAERGNTELIGEATVAPFVCEWKNPPRGFHNLVARAIDKNGATSESNVARVSVGLTNLALGKRVSASSKPETAANAVDGNLFTAWSGERPGGKPAKDGSAPTPANTELALELAPVQSTLSRGPSGDRPARHATSSKAANPGLELDSEPAADTATAPLAPGEWLAVDLGAEHTVGGVTVSWSKAYARDYRIEVSSDGQTWKPVFHEPRKSEFCGNTDVLSFPPLPARHVRLVCTAPGTPWGGYTVYEFGVYAALPSTTAP